MIRAGSTEEIHAALDNWVILDIGFANKATSCGLLIDNEPPVALRFSEAVKQIISYISRQRSPVNLIIEAPLSVAFDLRGNPKGRAVEKQGKKTRYWYVGPGCTVMVAALYLMRSIIESSPPIEVRLFEGFVSFKASNKKSNHTQDVLLLREVIESPEQYSESIIPPEELKMAESDTLQSAFLVAGIDAGIPPIIMRNS